MKVQVIYASRTGCTRKLAQAIYDGLPVENKSIHDLKDGAPVLDGDILLLGYWGVAGGPDPETKAFLSTIQGKTVGVFCTLGYYADSEHGHQTLKTGFDLLKEKNQILGGFVGNGAIARALQKGQGKDGRTPPTEQKELRWKLMASHPSEAECALAAERFRERIQLYTQCRELGISFQSVV